MKLKPTHIVVYILAVLFIFKKVSVQAAEGDIVTGGLNSVISAGNAHSLAVSSHGSVFVWGSNSSFQLGISGLDSLSPPKKTNVLPSQLKFLAVAAGTEISAALSEIGTVYVWGGKLDSKARELILPEKIVALSAGTDLLLLTAGGNVYSWSYTADVEKVEGLDGSVIAISAGTSHYLALSAAGEVYAWGYNGSGQLGNGTTIDTESPVKAVGIADIISIGAGSSHSLAVAGDGTLYAWGSNDYGQLGDGTTNNSSKPIKADLGLSKSKIVYVSAGQNFSAAVSDSGSVYIWGNGEYGQAGNGTSRAINKTAQVISGKDIKYISAGTSHVLALARNSTESSVSGWGRNKNKQVGTAKEDSIILEPITSISSAKNISNYEVDLFSGISGWAKNDAISLTDRNLLPRAMLTGYTAPITRGQLVSILVKVYEAGTNKSLDIAYSPFMDIADSIYKADIEKAYKLGIISGVTAVRFAPDAHITREQAAKVFCETISSIVPNVKINMTISADKMKADFVDYDSIKSWSAPYVYFMYENELMLGNHKGEFDPAGNMSVEQAIVVIRKMIDEFKLIK